MTTINTTDLEGKENKFRRTLKIRHFFGVENSQQLLVFKLLENHNGVYAVTADLTIKGITHPIKFEIVNGNMASTTLKVDRTKYDIKYGSGISSQT